MVFLTNHLTWSPVTVCALNHCRGEIEVFLKPLKPTAQPINFLGHSANAVQWQVWTALIVHLLPRLLAWRSGWPRSFARLFPSVRAAF